jgi:anaerobic ribonucleoside-triphosphate reductase activating protein
VTDGTTVQLSRAHFPVTVLGHGRRIGVWFQGCSIGCAGCVAHDTWEPDPARVIAVDALVEYCRQLGDTDRVDGVTISGGEPFDQPEALAALLHGLRPWADAAGRDLLCYSGRSLAALRAGFGAVLGLLDAVVPGPFVADQAPGKIWRGSANQDLVALTELGRRRYGPYVDAPADRPRLQAVVDGALIWYIGVPRPGDLRRIEAALSRRGVTTGPATWHEPGRRPERDDGLPAEERPARMPPEAAP